MERKLLRYYNEPFIYFNLDNRYFISNYRRDWIVVKSENYLRFFDKRISYMYCAKVRKRFEMNTNTNSEKFYRYLNEIPTVLFVIIVALAIFKPEI